MLTNLLPGLREIRTPLASGALWLILLWLLIAKRGRPPADEWPYDALTAAAGAVEVIGTGIALSFLAYLIGVLMEGIWSYPLSKAPHRFHLTHSGRQSLTMHARETLGNLLSLRRELLRKGVHESSLDETLSEYGVHLPRRDSHDSRASEGEAPIPYEGYVQFFLKHLPLTQQFEVLKTDLMTNNRELFSHVDRLQAESEFRLGVAFPLTTIFAYILLETEEPYYAILSALAFMLVVAGFSRRRAAGDVLARRLMHGHQVLPSLERSMRRLEAIREEMDALA